MFDEHTERVLEHVRSRKDWVLLNGRMLRRPEWQHSNKEPTMLCPLAGVSDDVRRSLDDDAFRAVIRAADCSQNHSPVLRAALLEAAGLSDKEER